MAKFEIKMPKLGESITEGTIIQWNVKAGDTIKEDDVLFEVSTAKVSAEIPSPVAGKITEILFSEGDVVPIGTPVAIVELEGESSETAESVAEPVTDSVPQPASETVAEPTLKPYVEKSLDEVISTVPTDESPKETQKEPDNKKNEENKITQENKASERWYSPAVLHLAQEAKIDQEELSGIAGTGYEGRVSKKDIEHYIEKKKKGEPVATEKKATASVPTTASDKPAVPVSKGSSSSAVTYAPQADEEVKEMDYVRRLIADHMVMSKKVSPHVTTIVEADVTNLVRWRDRTKDEFFKREGVRLTFMPAIVEATAKALAEFPQVNASVDGYKMILKKHINVGVAVALDNGNLIVPVVKNANQLNLSGLALAIDSLAGKARSNKLSPDDIQGGTFTITNFGTFKNIIGTPIINQPQVAILGVGYIEKKPAVLETPEGDVIAIRHKVYLSLSYDHRIIDGSLGGAFVRKIADYLEDWKI